MTAGLTELGVVCPTCEAPTGTPCVAAAAELSPGAAHRSRYEAAGLLSEPTDDDSTWRRAIVYRPSWDPEQDTPQPLVQYSTTVARGMGAKYDGMVLVNIDAGPLGSERIIPPAGEEYAYDRPLWRRRVQVSVSPKGRSSRVWVDGVEIPPPS